MATPNESLDAVCIGGANLDRKYRARGDFRMGTSNEADARMAFGGVARNVAENLARLGARAALLTSLGDDVDGRALRDHAARAGLDVTAIKTDPAERTAQYVALISHGGELLAGANDMRAIDAISLDDLARWRPLLSRAAWVFADCNLGAAVLREVVARRGATYRCVIDAVSETKAPRLPDDLHGVDLLFLNATEAAAYLKAWGEPAGGARVDAAAIAAHGADAVVVTLGEFGAILARGTQCIELPAVPARVADVTGAGDALIAATLHALAAGDDLVVALQSGMRLAAATVESQDTVRA